MTLRPPGDLPRRLGWAPPRLAPGRGARAPEKEATVPLSEKHPDDETWPGLLILRTEGRLCLGNAQNIGGGCGASSKFTALKMPSEGEAALRRQGVGLWLAALNPEALVQVQGSPLGSRLGRERMFFTVAQSHGVVVHASALFEAGPFAWLTDRRSTGCRAD